jgi:hypothetical protein
MPTVDYFPIATSANATVDTQANFVGSGYQLNGFQDGIADPAQCNKVWRQSSMAASALANAVAQILDINILDDGNIDALTANVIAAIKGAATGVVNGANGLVTVAFSATPVFDASQGSTFEITLTGNVTSSTIINFSPGQKLTLIVKEDSIGGHTFSPPTSSMSPISTAANVTNVQTFIVDSGSNVYQVTPLAVQ